MKMKNDSLGGEKHGGKEREGVGQLKWNFSSETFQALTLLQHSYSLVLP